MLTIFKRVLNAAVITSILHLFASASVAQPLQRSTALETTQPTNGVYLFSNAPQIAPQNFVSNGISASENLEYIVLQLDNNQVVGGFYQTLSEYSCFTGTVQGESLDLWVSPPDTTEAYAYSILTQNQSSVASYSNAVGLAINELALQGSYRITSLDQVSQNVLNACLTELNRG